jgi:hypothetical protein
MHDYSRDIMLANAQTEMEGHLTKMETAKKVRGPLDDDILSHPYSKTRRSRDPVGGGKIIGNPLVDHGNHLCPSVGERG